MDLVTLIVALLLAGVVVIVTLYPSAVLGVSLMFYAAEQFIQAQSPFFAARPTLLNYTYALIVVYALGISILQRGNPFVRIPAVAHLIYGLLGLSALSAFWAANPLISKELVFGHGPYIFVGTICVPLVIRDPKDLRAGLFAALFMGGPLAIGLALATETGLRDVRFSNVVVDRYGNEFEGGNPLAIASFGGYVALLGVYARRKGLSDWMAILRWLFVAVAFVLIVRSGSRGQFGGVILVILGLIGVEAVISGRLNRVGAGFFVLGLLSSIILWSLQFSRLEGRFDVSTWNSDFSDTRIALCSEVLKRWATSPSPVHWLLGLGTGASWDIIGTYPHVVPAEVLAELGLVGFALILTAYVLSFISALRLLVRSRHSPKLQPLFLALCALWLFELMMSLKQGSFLGDVSFQMLTIILCRMDLATRTAHAAMPRSRRVRVPRQAPFAAPSAG